MGFGYDQDPIVRFNKSPNDVFTLIQVIFGNIVRRWKHDLARIFLMTLVHVLFPHYFKRPLPQRQLFSTNGHFLGIAIQTIMGATGTAIYSLY